MKKSRILALGLAAVFCAGALSSCSATANLGLGGYLKKLDATGMFMNKFDNAIPQTKTAELVTKHFESALPEGKTAKKAIIIGFDGCRADALINLKDNKESGIFALKQMGGLYYSYAGGEPGTDSKQKTETGPGWSTVLTGTWVDQHGVYTNRMMISKDTPTFLTTLVQRGLAKKATFHVGWDGHLKEDGNGKGSFMDEAQYVKDHNINVEFKDYDYDDNDKFVHEAMMQDVTDINGSDIIFGIYEAPDNNGHGTGYGNNKPDYVQGVKNADAHAYQVIEAIKNRSSYEKEDWLIIMTTDHGGKGKNHNLYIPDDRVIYIASNQKIV